jgi:poly(ribitol-phosphate) beta-N-acetylglucosaminyltransferase
VDRTFDRPEVSVIVPTDRGSAWVGACLRTLADQTLEHERYEVVLVQHGRDDGTVAAVSRARSSHPGLRLRHLTLDACTRAAAKNVGLAAALGDWVTFVHDDDRVSPNLLRALRDRCGDGRVAVAFHVDTPPSGRPAVLSAPRLERQIPCQGQLVPLGRAPSALGSLAATMLPVDLVRRTGFDADLPTGEDAVLCGRILLAGEPGLSFCSTADDAVHYRSVAARGIRQESPGAVLSGIERLLSLPLTDRTALAARAWMVVEETDQLNRHLRAHPEAHGDVVAERRARGLWAVQPARLNRGVARDLAILQYAVPVVDTSANVAARRIRDAGAVVDVLTTQRDDEHAVDQSSDLVWSEYVDQVRTVPTKPVWFWWPGVTAFARRGVELLERQGLAGRYRSVYSRSTPVAPHVVAALYTLRHPGVRWVAEFSDPVLHDIDGSVRQSSGPADTALLAEFRAALEARGVVPPASDDLYLWSVTLAFALADEVVFTNEHQRDYMLEDFPDPALAARAREVAAVRPHPVPPAELYRLVPSGYDLEPGRVHIGYFGVLYGTRTLGEVLEALRRLDPSLRDRLRLHVFSRRPDDLAADVARGGLTGVVVAQPFVDYLEYLSLCTRLDVLLVNDASTSETHSRNPYLPSKYSDYVGSGTDVWGVVEPGSILSGLPMAHRSEIGDVEGALAVLEDLARRATSSEPVRSAHA